MISTGYSTSFEPNSMSALTGWGSREWTIGIIHNPADKKFYGKRNDRMQAFGEKGELNRRQIEMLADWLRGAAGN